MPEYRALRQQYDQELNAQDFWVPAEVQWTGGAAVVIPVGNTLNGLCPTN